MQLPIIYQDSFFVSGIMCASGCGFSIEDGIREYLKTRFLDDDDDETIIFIASSPMLYGMHKYVIEICSNIKYDTKNLTSDLKKLVASVDPERFTVFDNGEFVDTSPGINWLNIFINMLAVASIVVLFVIFPPSLFLGILFAVISFLVTLFAAREYIYNFFKALRAQEFLSMPVTVSLGLCLALTHTIYHLSFMLIIANFSMLFMSFIMPIILVSIVNLMDEIKRQIHKKSRKILLNGVESLFPEMQEAYLGVQLDVKEATTLLKNLKEFHSQNCAYTKVKRHNICENMLLKVKSGECFPVDGRIVFGNTYVEQALINGEPAAEVGLNAEVKSGCLNLWQDVVILSEKSEYYSTANRLLLGANTSENKVKDNQPVRHGNNFYYFYFGLFGTGFVITLVISSIFGTLTIASLLQTLVAILFAICPCTIGISNYLPSLLKSYQLHKEEIIINTEDENLNIADFDIFIFDKTGTLTSGSKVFRAKNIDDDLWKKIYVLEKALGRGHPVAIAIQKHVQSLNLPEENLPITKIKNISASGISAYFAEELITLGNAAFFKEEGINIEHHDTDSGTYIYVARNEKNIGNIIIRHQLRPRIKESLQKLKPSSQKKLIMLTGDKQDAADTLNTDINKLFDKIYAECNPEAKSETLEEIVQTYRNKKICFIGDGLNDALCSKKLQKLGGVSIAISSDNKAAFFTQLSLNGSLDYLFVQKEINQQEQKIIQQNKWLLALGAIIFLVFVIGFQCLGINLPSIIPVIVMFTTTVFVLFNSYRMQIITHNLLSNDLSILDKAMQSNMSTGLLIFGSLSLVIATLIASFATLQLSLPLFVFGGGVINIVSSSFLVAATTILGGYIGFMCAYAVSNYRQEKPALAEVCAAADPPGITCIP